MLISIILFIIFALNTQIIKTVIIPTNWPKITKINSASIPFLYIYQITSSATITWTSLQYHLALRGFSTHNILFIMYYPGVKECWNLKFKAHSNISCT